MDEQSISTLVLKDRGQNLCDEPRECVLRGLVQLLHLIGHIGVICLQIWKNTKRLIHLKLHATQAFTEEQ